MLKRVGVEFFTTREEAEKALADKQANCMIAQYVEDCEDCGFCGKAAETFCGNTNEKKV